MRSDDVSQGRRASFSNDGVVMNAFDDGDAMSIMDTKAMDFINDDGILLYCVAAALQLECQPHSKEQKNSAHVTLTF
jgi:hypothetical protein